MNPATDTHDSQPAPQGTHHGDSSGALFSMYLSRAEKFDKERSESWQGNADGILVFTGLFSATVAGFIIEGYKSLKPDPGIATVSVLAQLSQQLAGLSNGTHVSAVDPTVVTGFPFSPSASAIWVNALWFASLVTSLTCALLATLLQQWARRYLRRTQRRYSPHARARIRAFFAEGADRFRLSAVVEVLPALLHLSVFLFFAGLVIFLIDIRSSIAYGIIAPIAICALSYTVFTVIPILFQDSPFQTPLTTAAWYFLRLSLHLSLIAAKHLLAGLKETVGFVSWRIQEDIKTLSERNKRSLRRGIGQSLEDAARRQSWEMDARALAWTLDTLDEDHEIEQFMAGAPEFYHSKALTTAKTILGSLSGPNGFNTMLPWKILEAVEHASDGNQYPADVRQRRCRACLTALYFLPGAVHDILSAFRHASFPPQASLPFTLESWSIAAKLSPDIDDDVALGARCVAAVIATKTTFSDTFRATVLRSDEGYLPILVPQLGLPEHVLHSYLAGTGNGEDIRLANLVSFVWLTVKFARNMEASLRALTTAQRNVILSERERLREVRWTRSWDFAADGEGNSLSMTPPERISPPLILAANHDLLRLTLEYLSDPGLYDTPAEELLGDFREAWDHVETLQRDARSLGHSTHGFSMILEVLRPLRAQLFRLPQAEMDTDARERDEKLTVVSIEIECEEPVGSPHDEHTGASASTTMPLAFLEAPLALPSYPPSDDNLPTLKTPC